MSEEEKCRIRQIRAYADEYVNELENEVHSDFIKSIIKDTIEDAVRWADENPKSPWISVNERLPEIDEEMHRSETVYVISENSKYPDIDFRFSYANGKEAWWNPKTDYTHWMPIPNVQFQPKQD